MRRSWRRRKKVEEQEDTEKKKTLKKKREREKHELEKKKKIKNLYMKKGNTITLRDYDITKGSFGIFFFKSYVICHFEPLKWIFYAIIPI